MKTKYHRDGTITIWNVYTQTWLRISASHVPASVLATLSDKERARIARIARITSR